VAVRLQVAVSLPELAQQLVLALLKERKQQELYIPA
jgi:hypothetical protein